MNQKAIEDRWRKSSRKKLDVESVQLSEPVISVQLPEPVILENSMNKLEARFAREVLRPQEIMGEIRDWCYEPFKFILSHALKGKRRGTTYTPDFLAISNKFTIYEVKGHMEDDAAVKIKVAAELFPWFEWILVFRKRGEWIFQGV